MPGSTPPQRPLRWLALAWEVDVQAAFAGFVDDDRVVALQVAVVLSFREQNAIGHQGGKGLLGEAGEACMALSQFSRRRLSQI